MEGGRDQASDSTRELKQVRGRLRSSEGERGLLQNRLVLVAGVVVMMASTVCFCLLVCLLVAGDEEERGNCVKIPGLCCGCSEHQSQLKTLCTVEGKLEGILFGTGGWRTRLGWQEGHRNVAWG